MTGTDLREVARRTLPILPVKVQGVIGNKGERERGNGSVETGDDARDGEEVEPRVGANIGSIHECQDEEPTSMNADDGVDEE